MIKIVSFKICPFVQRVIGLLEAKALDYEVEYISLNDKPDWFLRLSPNGQVPLLITDGGEALFESDAIAEYLDEIADPLLSDFSPEQRAINRAWVYQASKHYLVQCSTMRSPDKETFKEKVANLRKAFAKVEAKLGDSMFFSGGTIGNVDIAWIVLLHRAAVVQNHSGYDMLNGFPKVKKWQQNLLASGIPLKSVPEDFVGRFSDFYLTDQTWLGRGALENEREAEPA